jgi:hypothetical protein
MTKFGVLIVEGPHDVKFIRRLIEPMGMTAIRMLDQVDDFYNPKMIPDYPPNGDIEIRVPIPAFFRGQDHCIAVQQAGGDSQLVEQLRNLTKTYDVDDFVGIGVLLDKDLEKSVAQRFSEIEAGFSSVRIALDGGPGSVTKGEPNRGVFVLPDNAADGSLEDILLDIASTTYPGLLSTAVIHIDKAIQDQSLTNEDLRNLKRADGVVKESGRKKAVVATIASALCPGRAVASSIQDNRWFRDANLQRPEIQNLQRFLAELFDLTIPQQATLP